MTQKYILTGGPGSGKSSIILELEAQGEHTIREAAEDIIRRNQAHGNPEPWTNPNFQKEILELQLQREQRIPQEITRVFIDRGIPDGLAYAQPGSETAQEIIRKTPDYDAIFLIESLATTQTDDIRRENHQEAQELARRLTKIYENLGYEVYKIQAGTLRERTNSILTYIEHDAMTQPKGETNGGRK